MVADPLIDGMAVLAKGTSEPTYTAPDSAGMKISDARPRLVRRVRCLPY